MALDFKRWKMSGDPVARIQMTHWVWITDLESAVQMMLAEETKPTKALIEKTIRNGYAAHGYGFTMHIGDWAQEADPDDQYYEEAKAVVARLYPDTQPGWLDADPMTMDVPKEED